MDLPTYLSRNLDTLLALSIEHVGLVVAALAAAVTVGVGLGILIHRVPFLRPPVLHVASTLLTIPSLALFSLLIPLLNAIGARPTIAALMLYMLLPIIRNTLAGLGGVDPAVVESAKGMGMSGPARLLRIELPLAWPVLLTGIRVATQLAIGIAAIAALVGGPGLGNEIFRGIRSLGSPGAVNLVIGGTLACAVLAFIFDLLYLGLGRATTARGIRD
jgi:osmoprotectant transport system permease protein